MPRVHDIQTGDYRGVVVNMITEERRPLFPPYGGDTVVWRVCLTTHLYSARVDVPQGPAYASGPGYVEQVIALLNRLADEMDIEYDLRDTAVMLLDDPDTATPDEWADAERAAMQLCRYGKYLHHTLTRLGLRNGETC